MKLTDLKDKLRKLLDKIINTDSKLYAMVGSMSVDEIKRRTRLGYGVPKAGGPKEELKKLSPSYIMARKAAMSGKAEFMANDKKVSFQASTVKPLNSSLTSPSKSNLTYTGQMLDSLTYNSSKNSVNITFENPESKQKAKYAHEEEGNRPRRAFLNLSDKEKNLISKEVKQYLLAKVKKLI